MQIYVLVGCCMCRDASQCYPVFNPPTLTRKHHAPFICQKEIFSSKKLLGFNFRSKDKSKSKVGVVIQTLSD